MRLDPKVQRLLEDRDWFEAQLERGLSDWAIASLLRSRGMRVSVKTVWTYRRRHRLPGRQQRQQQQRRRILRGRPA